jgi:hypothetical protein
MPQHKKKLVAGFFSLFGFPASQKSGVVLHMVAHKQDDDGAVIRKFQRLYTDLAKCATLLQHFDRARCADTCRGMVGPDGEDQWKGTGMQPSERDDIR